MGQEYEWDNHTGADEGDIQDIEGRKYWSYICNVCLSFTYNFQETIYRSTSLLAL